MRFTLEQIIEDREKCLEYLEENEKMIRPLALEAVRISVIALKEKLEREKGG